MVDLYDAEKFIAMATNRRNKAGSGEKGNSHFNPCMLGGVREVTIMLYIHGSLQITYG